MNSFPIGHVVGLEDAVRLANPLDPLNGVGASLLIPPFVFYVTAAMGQPSLDIAIYWASENSKEHPENEKFFGEGIAPHTVLDDLMRSIHESLRLGFMHQPVGYNVPMQALNVVQTTINAKCGRNPDLQRFFSMHHSYIEYHSQRRTDFRPVLYQYAKAEGTSEPTASQELSTPKVAELAPLGTTFVAPFYNINTPHVVLGHTNVYSSKDAYEPTLIMGNLYGLDYKDDKDPLGAIYLLPVSKYKVMQRSDKFQVTTPKEARETTLHYYANYASAANNPDTGGMIDSHALSLVLSNNETQYYKESTKLSVSDLLKGVFDAQDDKLRSRIIRHLEKGLSAKDLENDSVSYLALESSIASILKSPKAPTFSGSALENSMNDLLNLSDCTSAPLLHCLAEFKRTFTEGSDKTFQHHTSKQVYKVLGYAATDIMPLGYSMVYFNISNGNIYSRPMSDWWRSMSSIDLASDDVFFIL